jgi:hypothetical protein
MHAQKTLRLGGASTAMRVIPSSRRRFLVLVPALAGVEGEARIAIGAEASSNGGVRGILSLA